MATATGTPDRPPQAAPLRAVRQNSGFGVGVGHGASDGSHLSRSTPTPRSAGRIQTAPLLVLAALLDHLVRLLSWLHRRQEARRLRKRIAARLPRGAAVVFPLGGMPIAWFLGPALLTLFAGTLGYGLAWMQAREGVLTPEIMERLVAPAWLGTSHLHATLVILPMIVPASFLAGLMLAFGLRSWIFWLLVPPAAGAGLAVLAAEILAAHGPAGLPFGSWLLLFPEASWPMPIPAPDPDTAGDLLRGDALLNGAIFGATVGIALRGWIGYQLRHNPRFAPCTRSRCRRDLRDTLRALEDEAILARTGAPVRRTPSLSDPTPFVSPPRHSFWLLYLACLEGAQQALLARALPDRGRATCRSERQVIPTSLRAPRARPEGHVETFADPPPPAVLGDAGGFPRTVRAPSIPGPVARSLSVAGQILRLLARRIRVRAAILCAIHIARLRETPMIDEAIARIEDQLSRIRVWRRRQGAPVPDTAPDRRDFPSSAHAGPVSPTASPRGSRSLREPVGDLARQAGHAEDRSPFSG